MKVSFTNLTQKRVRINYRTLQNSEVVDFLILPPYALNLEFDLPEHKIEAIEKQLEKNPNVIMNKSSVDKAKELNLKNENERISHALELSKNEIQDRVDFSLIDSVVLTSNDDERNPTISQEVSKDDFSFENKAVNSKSTKGKKKGK